jgi:hypothetical protein
MNHAVDVLRTHHKACRAIQSVSAYVTPVQWQRSSQPQNFGTHEPGGTPGGMEKSLRCSTSLYCSPISLIAHRCLSCVLDFYFYFDYDFKVVVSKTVLAFLESALYIVVPEQLFSKS